MRQQLGPVSPPLLESDIQASRVRTRTDCIASLEEKVVQTNKKVASTIFDPLLSRLRVAIEKKVFD